MSNCILSHKVLRIIDTVANYCEVSRITSIYISQMFENTRLSRYPRPIHCIFDQGGDFMEAKIQAVLHRHEFIHTAQHRKILRLMLFVKDCTKQY